VEVVPDANATSKRWYKLRLNCRDEAKGPVTAVCGLNGYLVSSMGQKVGKFSLFCRILLTISLFIQLFVRAFDQDERLVGVAFLDVGVYVSSLRAVKNFLVIADVVKSVWFVAFQVCFVSFTFHIATDALSGRPIQTCYPWKRRTCSLSHLCGLLFCG
jgi:cleavage and polyadenylation specificity factor subunit 1